MLWLFVVWWIHIACCALLVELAVVWFWCCRTVGNVVAVRCAVDPYSVLCIVG